jgi:hypothetical protein
MLDDINRFKTKKQLLLGDSKTYCDSFKPLVYKFNKLNST